MLFYVNNIESTEVMDLPEGGIVMIKTNTVVPVRKVQVNIQTDLDFDEMQEDFQWLFNVVESGCDKIEKEFKAKSVCNDMMNSRRVLEQKLSEAIEFIESKLSALPLVPDDTNTSKVFDANLYSDNKKRNRYLYSQVKQYIKELEIMTGNDDMFLQMIKIKAKFLEYHKVLIDRLNRNILENLSLSEVTSLSQQINLKLEPNEILFEYDQPDNFFRKNFSLRKVSGYLIYIVIEIYPATDAFYSEYQMFSLPDQQNRILNLGKSRVAIHNTDEKQYKYMLIRDGVEKFPLNRELIGVEVVTIDWTSDEECIVKWLTVRTNSAYCSYRQLTDFDLPIWIDLTQGLSLFSIKNQGASVECIESGTRDEFNFMTGMMHLETDCKFTNHPEFNLTMKESEHLPEDPQILFLPLTLNEPDLKPREISIIHGSNQTITRTPRAYGQLRVRSPSKPHVSKVKKPKTPKSVTKPPAKPTEKTISVTTVKPSVTSKTQLTTVSSALTSKTAVTTIKPKTTSFTTVKPFSSTKKSVYDSPESLSNPSKEFSVLNETIMRDSTKNPESGRNGTSPDPKISKTVPNFTTSNKRPEDANSKDNKQIVTQFLPTVLPSADESSKKTGNSIGSSVGDNITTLKTGKSIYSILSWILSIMLGIGALLGVVTAIAKGAAKFCQKGNNNNNSYRGNDTLDNIFERRRVSPIETHV